MRYDPTLAAYVLLTLLLFWAAADRWAPDPGREVAGCRVGYVIDGDTVELICGAEKRSARLLGFDTPETREPGCPEEAALGRRAGDRLRELLRGGPVVIHAGGRDKYGRDLVRLTAGGRDVGAVLVAEGLARPYDGGARGGWCG